MKKEGATLTLFTVGYEGAHLDGWLARLREAGVSLLVDVRERAASRKKGFSKTALKEALENEQIAYWHLRNLGTPPPMRRKVKKDKDYADFFAKYNAHLDGQEGTLHELLSVLERETACLMCFEKDPRQCHRLVLAERISARYEGEVNVVHL